MGQNSEKLRAVGMTLQLNNVQRLSEARSPKVWYIDICCKHRLLPLLGATGRGSLLRGEYLASALRFWPRAAIDQRELHRVRFWERDGSGEPRVGALKWR